MTACDASYKFTYVDVGTPGRWSDGGTFDNCTLNTAISNGRLNLPAANQLPNSNRIALYVFVADEAFPLKTWLMRPIPGRSLDTLEKKIHKYRLSRARRTIENTFGIMVSRWRCLRGMLNMLPDNASAVVLACCILHNYMREKMCPNYCPPGYGDAPGVNGEIMNGVWRQEEGNVMRDVNMRNRNPAATASSVREYFVEYLSNEGSVNWQIRHVTRV